MGDEPPFLFYAFSEVLPGCTYSFIFVFFLNFDFPYVAFTVSSGLVLQPGDHRNLAIPDMGLLSGLPPPSPYPISPSPRNQTSPPHQSPTSPPCSLYPLSRRASGVPHYHLMVAIFRGSASRTRVHEPARGERSIDPRLVNWIARFSIASFLRPDLLLGFLSFSFVLSSFPVFVRFAWKEGGGEGG